MEKNRLCRSNGIEFDAHKFEVLLSADKKSSVCLYPKKGIVLKKYQSYTPKEEKLSERVFKEIKDINSPGLIVLEEPLYYGVRTPFSKELAGYTSEYAENEHTDIITMDSREFALRIVDKLDTAAGQLGSRNILMNGNVNFNDVVISEDGITITNIDGYMQKKTMSKAECTTLNKKMVVYYLKTLLAQCAAYRHNLGKRDEEIAKLFDFDITPSTDISTKTLIYLEHGPVINSIKKH